MNFETSALILTWAAIALLALAMSGLLRQVRILASTSTSRMAQLGPPIGFVAPGLEADSRGWPTPAVLMFLDMGCRTCQQVLRAFSDVATTNGHDVSYVAVFRGDADATAGSRVTMMTNQRTAFDRFHVPVTPFGVVLDGSGVVKAARPIGSTEAMTEFLRVINEGSYEHVSSAR